MLQNMSNNPMLGQHSNPPSALQSPTGEIPNPILGSSPSPMLSANITTVYPTQTAVQEMFGLQQTPQQPQQQQQPQAAVASHAITPQQQLHQLPTQPLSLSVFNQSPMMPTATNSDPFTHHHLHNNNTSPTHQLTSPTHLTSPTSHLTSPTNLTSPTLMHHQHIFASPPVNSSNSINHMDDITRAVDTHWEQRNSITDTPKVGAPGSSGSGGYLDGSGCVKDSNPGSPMVLNIEKYESEGNNFMDTLQQLNNDPQEFTSMPPTPAGITFGTSTFDTTPGSQQIDNDLVDVDEFGTSVVSVDYSDAFKSARACENNNAWPFPKGSDIVADMEQATYIEDISMFPTTSISSQPGNDTPGF